MHCLGIPTTRAGTCVTSDTRIVRDPLYDGVFGGGWQSLAEPLTVVV